MVRGFRSFLLILLLISCPIISPICFAETNIFSDWQYEQGDKAAQNLEEENRNLTSEDITRVKKRAMDAKSQKEWGAAASEYAHLAGKYSDKQSYWLELSRALQEKYKEDNNWQTRDQAKTAAIRAYKLASNPEEQGMALLVYGNAIGPESDYESPSYQEVYNVLQTTIDIKVLRKNHPELVDYMVFQFVKTRVNNQTIPPSACFAFSHPLSQKGVNYSDYVSVSPSVDAVLKIHGQELCLDPVQFGSTYDVTFKQGMPDAEGEKFSSESKVSFRVKDQDSRLSFSTKAYVLMRNETALVPLTSVNVETVKLLVLRINDRGLNRIMGESEDFLQSLWSYRVESLKNASAEQIYEGSMTLSKEKNKTVTTQFPFSDVVKELKPGLYVIYAEETGALFGDKAKSTQWLIVSDIGLTTFYDESGQLTVQARSLKTSDPLADIELQLLANSNAILGKVKTNKEGIATFNAATTRGKGGNRPLLLLAFGPKNDFSLLNLQQPAFDLSDRGVEGQPRVNGMGAFLFAEQGVFRPGETVHINALLRDDKAEAKADLPLTFKVLRPDQVEVKRETIVGNALGFYEFVLPLEESVRMGGWTVLAYLDPKNPPVGRLQFAVEDFVPSRIAVEVLAANKNEMLQVKKPFDALVKAHYLFGAKASGLEGKANLILRPNKHPFPEYQGFSYGLSTDDFREANIPLSLATLDKEGSSTLKVEFDTLPKTTLPLEALVRVTLSDSGGRPESGSLKMPVMTHPYFIGIKPQFQGHVVPEESANADFEVITVSGDEGKLVSVENLEYELYQEEFRYSWYQSSRGEAWQYQITTLDKFLEKGTLGTMADKPKALTVALKDWGHYRLEIRDPKTDSITSVRFEKGWLAQTAGSNTPDQLSLKSNKKSYNIGETAELEIESPFEGQGVLTIANQGILEMRNIKISKNTKIKIPVKENFGVGAYVMVSAFRPLSEKGMLEKPFLPKRAIGVTWLQVDAAMRSLKVEFDTPKEVLPRQEISIPISVEAVGKGNNLSQVSVSIFAVDEGILKLTEFKTPNPIAYFFEKRALGLELRDLYGRLISPLEGPVGALRSGGDAELLSRNRQALSKRSFRVVSLYQGLVNLDKNGKGEVKLNLPDFEGTLRLMGVAFDGKRLGFGEKALLVRDKVVMEAVLPRFLAPLDESSFYLSLHNVAGKKGKYQVVIKTEGNLISKSTSTLDISLDEEGKFDKRLPLLATAVGEGAVILTLSGPDVNVTRRFDLSIRAASPYVMRKASHHLKPHETITLDPKLIEEINPDTFLGTVNFSTNVPWDTSALFIALSRYPYTCVEQTVSRAIGSLLDKPSEDNKTVVNNALGFLSEKQLANGSFNLWASQNGNGDVWLTAYAADFMLQAKEKGLTVPQFTLDRTLAWLEDKINSRLSENGPALSSASYGLYVLSKASRIDTGTLRYFYDTYYDKIDTAFGRAALGAALLERGENDRANNAFQQAFEGNQATSQALIYGTALRDSAAAISFMREAESKGTTLNASIDALQSAIASEFNQVSSLSTQELVWGLMAARSYGKKENTPYTVKINEETFTSSSDSFTRSLTLDAFKNKIRVENSSDSPLWENETVSFIPEKPLPAASHDIVVSRYYLNLAGDRTTTVKQGEQLQVVIEGKALSDFPHQLLVVDLLPAGFEIENGSVGQEGITQPQYVDLRDDRFLASLFLDAETRTFTLTYIIRAVTPGKYILPGLFVEDMYAPQYYARTETGSITVAAP